MTGTHERSALSAVATYYGQKLSEYGESARGVDWKNDESQFTRFRQLLNIIDDSRPFSLNDLGCGYGALLDFLTDRYRQFDYAGVDVCESMIRAAEQRFHRSSNARFLMSNEPDKIAEYGVASGIFNVRLDSTNKEWRDHLESTLDVLDRTSRLGFAFNCLTSYSDADKRRDYLYYANPGELFDFCKRRYSRNVSLLHDYGLYEFTILVRKRL